MDFNTQNYFNIAEPDLQGDSLISELGFKYLMQNLELYSALKAYTGKREGVSIKLRGFWKF
ncbi:hypothetical protein [Campylobacter sp. US33a]|uniref:hypothetical protein n=1 Tax=Campylobacter sp. US33a TaxID=2498120 RepID=UPI001ABB5D10|nr:hypothetical protein [Campylobacter sp. US33a]